MLENELRKIMADVFEVRSEEINDKASMKTIAEWDSLKHVALIIALEDNYDLPQFTVDEIIEMTTFKKITEMLKSKLDGRQ